MLTVVIHSEEGLATMNIRINADASDDDLRDAWNNAANGLLLMHLREALRFECINRGVDPSEIIIEPPLP